MQERVKPGDETIFVGVRVPASDLKKYKEHAAKCGQDLSTWIRAACESRARRSIKKGEK